MSLQTGVETPSGPMSQRLGDRVRFRWTRFTTDPNPLWMREMRQSARLLRTPIVLMVLTVLMTLLMASIGGVMMGGSSPAEAGQALFHTYFSLAYFVVTLVGPALAANSIASEREGKTWEAVLLTGMRPSEVARGKFLSSYTAIAVYIVMLAPVGAVPFLFGGITPLEVLVAFVFLFLIALLSVAFGLAISSKMESLRAALLVTLLVAIPLSVFFYSSLGVGLSAAVHELWDTIPAGPPIWLPTAYSRAPFGIRYVVYLVILPLVAVVLPAWLLYEVTRANLTSVTDDRTYGLKRWFIVASLVLAPIATIPMFEVSDSDRAEGLILGMGLFCFHLLFSAFLFAAEPIGPSRRVKEALSKASRWRRALAPGVARVAGLQLLIGLGALAALALVGVLLINVHGVSRASTQTEQLIVFTAYATGFTCFVIGVSAALRSRATGAAVPRVLLLVVLFLLTSGPWILAAISGVITEARSSAADAMAIAAPSPIYAIVAVVKVKRPDPGVVVLASMIASVCYAALGALFVVMAKSRCQRIVREHETVLSEADRRLEEEDQLREERAEQAERRAEAELEQDVQHAQDEQDEQDAQGEQSEQAEHDEHDEPSKPGEDLAVQDDEDA